MKRDLGNSEYEPTDEDLHQLARDAFADVPARHHEAQRRLREEIEVLRTEAMARLAAYKLTEP